MTPPVNPPYPDSASLGPASGALGWVPRTLRAQFTLVIALFAFVPNLVLTLASTSQLSWAAVLWMVAVALISGVIGYVLSGALVRPLQRLESEVAEGDFAQFHRDDPREIRALRRAFCGLMNRLGTEQTRRNAFMATLVHDLKTPLIATGHLTQALTTLPLPENERREVGEQIQAETARLLNLVQQMADAHRFERDDVVLQTAPTDLRGVAEQVTRRLHPQAVARNISLQLVGEGFAEVDAAALERALNNLADNALRYARTQVRLCVSPTALQIQDDGPGLAAPLDELAQPFNAQPATIAGKQYTAGTAGLGLFISRRIAEAHGGALTYSRQPPDSSPEASNRPTTSAAPVSQGDHAFTTFTLTLPEDSP